jgi:hypothetical protein
MAWKPAEPSTTGGAEQGESDAAGESAQPREHVGPLAIERLRKDDGRALILYSSHEQPRA